MFFCCCFLGNLYCAYLATQNTSQINYQKYRIHEESYTELEKENKCSHDDLLYYDDKFTFETSA